MSQLSTLIWLKWRLFRNSFRSSKAVVNRVASGLALLAALILALLVALGLGAAAYALNSPEVAASLAERGNPDFPPTEFIFFAILALCYLLWSTLPLSIGSARQFDPGNLLLYPISLGKLFAIDLVSELASLQSVFAIPSLIAMGVGAGLAHGNVAGGIFVGIAAAVFGIALSKWISISLGSILRRKQARGETLLALMGVVAGLGGAVFAQVAPVLFRHAESFQALRWTPPGAAAYALTHGLKAGHLTGYAMALAGIFTCSAILIAITYWLARRVALGAGGKRRTRPKPAAFESEAYTGWKIPLLSFQLSAIIEKELRYISRNAQVRMMALMPLILILVRIMNRRRLDELDSADGGFAAEFFRYGEGLMATIGVLYVFLILSGLFCNQFAFEHSGMRTLILSPVNRRTVLVGKNIAYTVVALILSAALMVINEIIFRDLTPGVLLFVFLSSLIFAALLSLMGNWLSIRFPKRMKFGKSSNVSGIVGLLLIPIIFLLTLPPLAATAAGYVAQSLLVEYATLAVVATLSIVFYLLVINYQGESLQRRELEILEAVNEADNG